MKLFNIQNTDEYEYEYNQLLEENRVFDFVEVRERISNLERTVSNLNSVINSLHDVTEYFNHSFISLKFAKNQAPYIEDNNKDYFWVFYYHNVSSHVT